MLIAIYHESLFLKKNEQPFPILQKGNHSIDDENTLTLQTTKRQPITIAKKEDDNQSKRRRITLLP